MYIQWNNVHLPWTGRSHHVRCYGYYRVTTAHLQVKGVAMRQRPFFIAPFGWHLEAANVLMNRISRRRKLLVLARCNRAKGASGNAVTFFRLIVKGEGR